MTKSIEESLNAPGALLLHWLAGSASGTRHEDVCAECAAD